MLLIDRACLMTILYKIKKETNSRFYQYCIVIIFDSCNSQKKIGKILRKLITILDVFTLS